MDHSTVTRQYSSRNPAPPTCGFMNFEQITTASRISFRTKSRTVRRRGFSGGPGKLHVWNSHPIEGSEPYTPDVIEDHARTCCSPHRAGSDGASTAAPDRTDRTDVGAAAQHRARVVVLPPDGSAEAEFLMGTEDAVADPADLEGPVRRVSSARFAIATTAVTNADFGRFVEETGHVTTAERFGDSLVFAGRITSDRPHMAVAAAPWWRVVPGACWRHPEGPDSNLEGRDDHPVVHVSHLDATAYCE